jgi:hypothetical protein
MAFPSFFILFSFLSPRPYFYLISCHETAVGKERKENGMPVNKDSLLARLFFLTLVSWAGEMNPSLQMKK